MRLDNRVSGGGGSTSVLVNKEQLCCQILADYSR